MTSPGSRDPITSIDRELQEIYGARRWVVASDVVQGAGRTVRRLRGWGAPRCFGIAARTGVGDVPPPEDWEHHVLGLPAAPIMEAIQSAEDALRDLPPEVTAAVDAFDPEHRAEVIGAIFSDGRPVAGRRFWGARPKVWRDLEDKVVVDSVWDQCGVPRVQTRVVPIVRAALGAAHLDLDRGLGTVWAGDASRGFHGGGAFTFPVVTDDDGDRAFRTLATRCERARVMPFLAGIPCSIHGIVFPDHVVVLRPAELLVLRHALARRFEYCRADTFWDPASAVRAEMRDVATAVGRSLRETLGYRGAFTVDGVATAGGFRPTELNPRVGAALGLMVPDFPFSFLHDALVEGVPIRTDPRALEEVLLTRADTSRRASVSFFVPGDAPSDTTHVNVAFDGDTWREVAAEDADGELAIGPGATGVYVSLALEHGHAPVGPSLAPRVAALAAWLDLRPGDHPIGPLIPATPA